MRQMSKLSIRKANTPADASDLDALLWNVLWKPLGLSRDVRKGFSIKGEQVELVALMEGHIVGGLVAVWTDKNSVEIRHIAVSAEKQCLGIGKKLVTVLIEELSLKGCRSLHTIARNSSVNFFKKLNFQNASGIAPEHPVFVKHNITFHLMERHI
jgi:N-acetylglutamate synthase-like GNAT family acetyltransferase